MGQFMDPIRMKGTYDLEDTENKCETIQNLVPCKLVRLTKKLDDATGNFNAAVFEEIEVGTTAPRPKLIPIDDPTDIPSKIAEQMAEGRKLIFDSTMFVENIERRVLGFR
jgi:hypothetical protein